VRLFRKIIVLMYMLVFLYLKNREKICVIITQLISGTKLATSGGQNVQSNLDISNSDISNSAKFEVSI